MLRTKCTKRREGVVGGGDDLEALANEEGGGGSNLAEFVLTASECGRAEGVAAWGNVSGIMKEVTNVMGNEEERRRGVVLISDNGIGNHLDRAQSLWLAEEGEFGGLEILGIA